MNGLNYLNYQENMAEPVGRPCVLEPKPAPEPVTVWKVCLSTWAPEQSHNCNEEERRNNVEEMVRNNITRSREMIISSQLKKMFQEQGASTRGGAVNLTTEGTPISASLGKTKEKPVPKFTNDSLQQLQLKMGTSDNKMKILGNYLRINCGRDSVNKLSKHMAERNVKLAEHFDVISMEQTEYV